MKMTRIMKLGGVARWIVLLAAWLAMFSKVSAVTNTNRTLVVLGDSLSAAYGIDPSKGFVALLQGKIRDAGLGCQVVNAGVTGETTAGGLRRVDWIFRKPVDVLLIELGGNDGLRGVQPEVTRTNLIRIIQQSRARNPNLRVLVAGMQMPANFGAEYSKRYEAAFVDAAKLPGVVLIPQFMEGVGGRPELNLPDGIHPTPRGHEILAGNIWKFLEPVLRESGAATTSVRK